MNVRLVFALFPLLVLCSSLYAQSPCLECFAAAEAELKHCLDNAISADDKISCDERRQTGMMVCVNGECKIERDEHEQRATRSDQQTPTRPGLTPYTPTNIEWLALSMRASLKQNASTDSPYSLDIVLVDHETLQILVRYYPTVNREVLNRAIDSARAEILSIATRYGWNKWIKIRERVEMYPSPK